MIKIKKIFLNEHSILLVTSVAISKKTDLKLVTIALGPKIFISVFKVLHCSNDYKQTIFHHEIGNTDFPF